MYNTDFSDDLPVEKKEYYSHEVERLSKRSAMADEDTYELISRQRAMISRKIMGEIEEEEAFALFFYGRYGLMINYSLRFPKNITQIFRIKDINRAQELVKIMRARYNLTTKETIRTLDKATNDALKMDIVITNYGGYSKAFTMVIDNIVEKYTSRFTKSNYLYRIFRVQKTAYSPPSEIQNPKLRKITTGDIIMDRGLWSTAMRAETTIYRYSLKGEAVTDMSDSYNIVDEQEEVLYIIENNEHLKAIDISGYKFLKRQEGRTSGELLIKSHTKFKVIGIQKSEPRLDRKIVILEPVSDDSLKPGQPIKNPYDGSIYDPITLPAVMRRTSIPDATASTSAINTGAGAGAGAVSGAVGGATGSSLPDPFIPDILP
jgi:hypothetical protein